MTNLGITGIGHVAIRARDLDTLLAFYTSTLGFAEMFRINQDDGSLMLVYVCVTDGQFLEFFPNGVGERAAPRDAVGLSHICLTSTDLDATVAALAARGVLPLRPIVTGRDGNRQAWIADPEGNRIEFMETSPSSKQEEALSRLRKG